MKISNPRFKKPSSADFYPVLRERVDNYFKTNNISAKGDWSILLKTGVLLGTALAALALIYLGLGPYWLYLVWWVILGVAIAGMGLSVMHDANHGTYSDNATLNKYMSYSMNVLGGCDLNWRIQHNILHHSFTNIDGHDDDILAQPMLRFSPNQPLRRRHRFQHLYGWFLYGMMTLFWVTFKDFFQLVRYEKQGLLSTQKITLKRAMIRLAIWKGGYHVVMLVFPLILSPFSWWQVLLGFVIMHFVTGWILSLIFQPAHVIPETMPAQLNVDGQPVFDWAEHQLRTTANFATNSKWFTWYTGGLNHQIEHHLFPGISHIHYGKISRIVKETAKEFGLPYYSAPTFLKALINHGTMLKQLGRTPQVINA